MMKSSYSLEEAKKNLGLGFIHLLFTWYKCGRIFFDQNITWPTQLEQKLRERGCLRYLQQNQYSELEFLGTDDLFVTSSPNNALLSLACKVITLPPSADHWDGSFLMELWQDSYLHYFDQFLASKDVQNLKRPSQSTLFLDRDGVVIEHIPYIKNKKDVVLKEGIIDLIQSFRARNYRVVIVTNQSGLGRGLFSVENFSEVQTQMLSLLAQKAVWIDACYHSFYWPQSSEVVALQWPSTRKPRPGLLFQEQQYWPYDLESSVLVGDNISDMELAMSLQLKRAYLIHNPHLAAENQKSIPFQFQKISSLKEITVG